MEKKELNSLARQAGAWAALTFIGILLAAGLLVGILRGSFQAIADSREASERAAETEADAKVNENSRRLLEQYAQVILAEREALQRGAKPYKDAKRASDEVKAQVEKTVQTVHETTLFQRLDGERGLFEACGDFVYDSYGVEKLSNCLPRLSQSKVEDILHH